MPSSSSSSSSCDARDDEDGGEGDAWAVCSGSIPRIPRQRALDHRARACVRERVRVRVSEEFDDDDDEDDAEDEGEEWRRWVEATRGVEVDVARRRGETTRRRGG